MPKKRIVIAIDGPAGSGKSTTARLVAQKLGFLYIDSGAIYRAYTLQVLRKGVALADTAKLKQLLNETRVSLEDGAAQLRILLNGEDVSDEIRSAEVTAKVSEVSENKWVRRRVTEELRRIAGTRSVVLDGRDIGTVVFPEAQVKIFLQASIEERARRRGRELQEKGVEVPAGQLQEEIARRDRIDSERDLAPLKKADDAIVLDTTDLKISEGVNFIVKKAKKVLYS